MLEQKSETGEIDLYYGDETRISEEGYVPYGWQFKDENIAVKSSRRSHINCFGIITRSNKFIYQTTKETIAADFIIEQLDMFSWTIKKHTVIVLDNAKTKTYFEILTLNDTTFSYFVYPQMHVQVYRKSN